MEQGKIPSLGRGDILPTSSALLPSSGRWITGRSSHVFTLGRRCSPGRGSRAATLDGTRSGKHSGTRQQATAGNSKTVRHRVAERSAAHWVTIGDLVRTERDAVTRLDDDEKNTVILTDGIPGNPNKMQAHASPRCYMK